MQKKSKLEGGEFKFALEVPDSRMNPFEEREDDVIPDRLQQCKKLVNVGERFRPRLKLQSRLNRAKLIMQLIIQAMGANMLKIRSQGPSLVLDVKANSTRKQAKLKSCKNGLGKDTMRSHSVPNHATARRQAVLQLGGH